MIVRTRALLSAVVVALAVCAVAAASASATTVEPYFKAENTKGEVTTLAEGQTRSVTATLPYAGEMHIPELGISIYCTVANGSGVVYNNYVSKTLREGRLKSGVITFEDCGVNGAPECYVDGAISGAGKITTNTIAGRLGYQPGGSPTNAEAALSPEEVGGLFTTIKISECALEGGYKVKGTLVAGVGPINTLLERTVQGVTALEGVQEFKSIEFPVAKEKLEGQELKYGAHSASIEGALEFVVSGGEKLGIFTS
jgi:hypothetical protein